MKQKKKLNSFSIIGMMNQLTFQKLNVFGVRLTLMVLPHIKDLPLFNVVGKTYFFEKYGIAKGHLFYMKFKERY